MTLAMTQRLDHDASDDTKRTVITLVLNTVLTMSGLQM